MAKIKLSQITETRGDCTAGYSVTMDKPYTVGEFIQEVLTKDEWGYIGILDENQAWYEFGNPYCEYKRNKLLSEMPVEILNMTVTKAQADGGWSRMDYKLTII